MNETDVSEDEWPELRGICQNVMASDTLDEAIRGLRRKLLDHDFWSDLCDGRQEIVRESLLQLWREKP